MADRREDFLPGSPSKRPRLDFGESQPEICQSGERKISTLPTGSNRININRYDDGISEPATVLSSSSDRVDGLQLSSTSGALFELQGQETVSDQASVVRIEETSEADQNISDSNVLKLHDSLADISEIPTCSQATLADLSGSRQESALGENEPSSSQISSNIIGEVTARNRSSFESNSASPNSSDVMIATDQGASGSSSTSPNCNVMTTTNCSASGSNSASPNSCSLLTATNGRASGNNSTSPNSEESEDDDSDLDLELGNWQPVPPSGPMGWLQKQMIAGTNPRHILNKMLSTSANFPDDMDEFEMWSLIIDYFRMLQEPPRRKKLNHINTFDDALHLLQTSRKILVLTGAGVSVSCGIPDFRSRDGVYARLAVDFPDLPDPQAMFDINYFRRDPRPFFKFAKEIYPGQFRPSTSHKFISLLEQHGQLLRNYTQNIDTLEQVVGITKVVQCHGSFATAKCTNCSYKVNADVIREDIFNQVVPLCPRCPQDTQVQALMKPEIVFFGEGLPNEFYNCLEEDKDQTDLLIVIGSSLKVRPVATIPNSVSAKVPQILINREPLRHMTFDMELLGDCDVIINELCHRLGDGWKDICHSDQMLTETTEMPDSPGVAAAKEQEFKAKEEFENMPTPPLVQQEPSGDEIHPVAPSESHPAETSGTDGVSSSSDATHHGQQEVLYKDTNEAEAAYGSIETDGRVAYRAKAAQRNDNNDEIPSNSESLNTGSTFHGSVDIVNCVDSSTGNDAQRKSMQHIKDSSEDVASSTVDRTTVAENSLKQEAEAEEKKAVLQTHTAPELNDIGTNNETSRKLSQDESTTKHEQQLQCVTNKSKVNSWNVTEQRVNRDTGKARDDNPDDIAGTRRDLSGASGATCSKDDQAGSSSEPRQSQAAIQDPSHPQKRKRIRSSIGTCLLPSTFLFVPPSRYIFHGAEVYPPSSSECSDDEDGSKGQHLDSSSDPLHLDRVNPSALDSSCDLSDPFDSDQMDVISLEKSKPFCAGDRHTLGQESCIDLPDNPGHGILGEASSTGCTPVTEVSLGLDELPPLVLSGADGPTFPVDHISTISAGQSAVNLNGEHSVQQALPGLNIPHPLASTDEGKHCQSHISYSKQRVSSLVSNDGITRPQLKENIDEMCMNVQTVNVNELVNDAEPKQAMCQDESHDKPSSVSHERLHDKLHASDFSSSHEMPNGSNHSQVPPISNCNLDKISGNNEES